MSIRCHGETLSEVTLPPHEPQPKVIDGGSAVEKPMAPCVVGELTMMREAGISMPNDFAASRERVWMPAVCPMPPYERISKQRAAPLSKPSSRSEERRVGHECW